MHKADTQTLHPTCSVNREQDVADIWVREQTREGFWRESEREREGIETGERGVGGQMKW